MTRRRMINAGVALIAAACALAALEPATADAADEAPCNPQIRLAWSEHAVHLCPLTAPLANNTIPVYRTPVPNKAGATPPAPTAGVLNGTGGKYFVCERHFPNAAYHHPSGWWNSWWAYTRASNNRWGWVPEAFFKGGLNNEPDAGLRGGTCPPAPSPPPPEPPPDPTPPPSPVGLCEVGAAQSEFRVRARFANSRRVTTARFGRRLRVRGRVVSADGSAAAGAVVCVGVQASRGRPVRRQALVTADARGRFDYRLGRGSSRRVFFVHRAGGAAAATSVRVRVRAPVVLRASPRSLSNGQTVLLRGRLGGSSRGLLVELQYARGRQWLNFANTRVGRGGRFRFAYRFTRTFSPRNYRFRARAPAQRGYPFVAGASRPLTVRVLG